MLLAARCIQTAVIRHEREYSFEDRIIRPERCAGCASVGQHITCQLRTIVAHCERNSRTDTVVRNQNAEPNGIFDSNVFFL